MKKNSNNFLIVGLGGGGGNIVNAVLDKTDLVSETYQSAYVNFANTDISNEFKGIVMVVDGNGTGRNPEVGRQIIEENSVDIYNFFSQLTKNPKKYVSKAKKKDEWKPERIILVSTLGGGSGASLIEHAIQAINDTDEDMPVSLVAVAPSSKEGVATVPNYVKTFKNLYNEYSTKGKLSSIFLFDNEVFEKKYGLNLYDYTAMNEIIAYQIENIFSENVYKVNKDGESTIDLNEHKRVLDFGKGVSDYAEFGLDLEDDIDEFKYKSSIFDGALKLNSAKAVSVLVRFQKNKKRIEEETYDNATTLVAKLKKRFSSAFFVVGFDYDNKDLLTDYQIRVLSNGLNVPKSLNSEVKKAAKSVEKIKKDNDNFEIEEEVDLDF